MASKDISSDILSGFNMTEDQMNEFVALADELDLVVNDSVPEPSWADIVSVL